AAETGTTTLRTDMANPLTRESSNLPPIQAHPGGERRWHGAAPSTFPPPPARASSGATTIPASVAASPTFPSRSTTRTTVEGRATAWTRTLSRCAIPATIVRPDARQQLGTHAVFARESTPASPTPGYDDR